MNDAIQPYLLFFAGMIFSLIGWLLRQRISVQESENQRISEQLAKQGDDIEELRRAQHDMASRPEFDQHKRDISGMIDSLRHGLSEDMDRIRRTEIKELYELIRTETRETRQELRNDLHASMNQIREEVRAINTCLSGRG